MSAPTAGFILRFAWRDLIDRRGRATALILALTLGALSAVTAAALMTPGLSERRQKAEVVKSPLSSSTWARPEFAEFGKLVAPDELAALETELRREMGDRIAAVRGFYAVRYEFGPALRAVGRTFAPDDPLLAKLPLKAGETPNAESPLGLMATEALLERLDLPFDASVIGRTLDIQLVPAGTPVRITVVAVLRDNLPLGHQFAVTLPQDDAFGAVPDDPAAYIISGPMPAAWPDKISPLKDKTKRRLEEMLEARNINFPPEVQRSGSGERNLRLDYPDAQPPRPSEWKEYLKVYADIMAEGEYATAAEEKRGFAVPGGPAVGKAKPKIREGFDWVGVQVADPSDLGIATTVLRRLQFSATEGAAGQLRALAAAAGEAARMMRGVLVGVWLAAAINLFAMQMLRLKPKLPEFGLLRALGTSRPTLALVGAIQGLVLWLGGTLIAAALLALAFWAAERYDAAWLPDAAIWDAARPALGWFVGMNLLLCCLSGSVAMWWAGRRPPALAMAGS